VKKDCTCIKTLKGHSNSITMLVALSHEQFCSFSQNNIKVWDVFKDYNYVRTININNDLDCLWLLFNGDFAFYDYTEYYMIRILGIK
jgi:hypothetical protein